MFTLVTILFIASGLIHYAEAGKPGSGIHTFGDALYFAVVTFSTVGLGDITPVTAQGRLFTVLTIVSCLILIPWQVGRLVQLLISAGSHRMELPCPECGMEHHKRDARYCRACGALLFPEQAMD